jgi:hypothetical protein
MVQNLAQLEQGVNHNGDGTGLKAWIQCIVKFDLIRNRL